MLTFQRHEILSVQARDKRAISFIRMHVRVGLHIYDIVYEHFMKQSYDKYENFQYFRTIMFVKLLNVQYVIIVCVAINYFITTHTEVRLIKRTNTIIKKPKGRILTFHLEMLKYATGPSLCRSCKMLFVDPMILQQHQVKYIINL